MAISVWAATGVSHVRVCTNPSLPGLFYPDGGRIDQGGWDFGINFGRLESLVADLVTTPVPAVRGQKIERLAFDGHGGPGVFQFYPTGAYFDNDHFGDYAGPLKQLNGVLTSNAVVIFMGCNMGQRIAGSDFLKRISTEIFPGKRVVGFITTGYTPRGLYRPADKCSSAGMKDTDYTTTIPTNPGADTATAEADKYPDSLVVSLPWASESSIHAKVAQDGKIIKDPEGGIFSGEVLIVGRWNVEIGDWRGVFVFGSDHTVYWADLSGPTRHPGRWSMSPDGTPTWQFNDDTPGWVRTWIVNPPLNVTLNGKAVINGIEHGVFKMWKESQ
jgi:hypothetical protein